MLRAAGIPELTAAMSETDSGSDGIVLLAKRPGMTSFASLYDVKKALGTSKVGHTGTLDSFASGLLVVCAGRLTRLAARITEFGKTYTAAVRFGEETDTLEYTGKTIRAAPLPSAAALESAVLRFTGDIMQSPPAFSAVHVGGRRASDAARAGVHVEIPPRKVTVYSAGIKSLVMTADGFVSAAEICFSVSKGTYIRCLARDIAASCGSAAHLAGLCRTAVGNFELRDAAGYSLMPPFSLENSLAAADAFRAGKNPFPAAGDDFSVEIRRQIAEGLRGFSPGLSSECGFVNLTLSGADALSKFRRGMPLVRGLFSFFPDVPAGTLCSVFSPPGEFAGLIETMDGRRPVYKFVMN